MAAQSSSGEVPNAGMPPEVHYACYSADWRRTIAFDHIPGELGRRMGLFADSCHPILEAYFRQPSSEDFDWDDLRAKANEKIEELKAEAKENGQKEDSWIYVMLLPAILNFLDPLTLPHFSAIIHYAWKGKENRWADHLKLEMQLISYFLRHVKDSGGEVLALAMGKMYDALSELLEYSVMELYCKPGTSECNLGKQRKPTANSGQWS